jgi:hypothetical protein
METKRLYKLESLELFRKHGLPVLDYIVLDKDNFESQINAFLKKTGTTLFCVRTDGLGKFSPSINNASLKDNKKDLERFFKDGYTVFIMHPGNIHTNLHGLNIMKDGEEVILESAGPGFITHDLNKRGQVHEETILTYPSLQVVKRTFLGAEKYKEMVSNKIKEFPLAELEAANSYLFQYPDYVPITDEELGYIRGYFNNLLDMSRDLGSENFIASLSFINFGDGKHKPIFWDLYTI